MNEKLTPEIIATVQMLLESLPPKTLEFYFKIYPHLTQDNTRYLTQKEMGDIYGCTPSGAKRHVSLLTDKGYLSRENYRSWCLAVVDKRSQR